MLHSGLGNGGGGIYGMGLCSTISEGLKNRGRLRGEGMKD